jgi:hypothetical protein
VVHHPVFGGLPDHTMNIKRVQVVASVRNPKTDHLAKGTHEEVARAYDLFWTKNKISHFENGVAIRTNEPRVKPSKWKPSDIGF